LKASLNDVPGLRFLPLDLPQIEIFGGLRKMRDPFDRLIVSAALALGARLITKDSALSESGLVESVW
jgi:PIN domain nuclease of toxin-antitoxin system